MPSPRRQRATVAWRRTDCQDREPAGGSARAAPPACKARQCGAAGAIAPPAMARPALEVADIFRDHGPAWREANRGHVSLDQLKVMSAIERCRTAALGGHVARCENTACGHAEIGYNSCRNRHCPKCQGRGVTQWLDAARSRTAGHAVLSRRIHAAEPDCATSPTRTSASSTIY